MGSTSMASTSDRSSEPSIEPRPAPRAAERTLAKDGSAAARADQAAPPDHDAAPTTGSPHGASPPHPWRKRLLWAVAVVGLAFGGYHLRGAAVGLLALLRNEGGSVGTSMAQTLQERRDQFHTSRVGEFLDPFNPAVNSYLEQARAFFFQQTGDAAGAQQMALQTLADLRHQQAASMAYFDVFWVAAVLAAALVFLVLLMKRSVAEKGAHIGAE